MRYSVSLFVLVLLISACSGDDDAVQRPAPATADTLASTDDAQAEPIFTPTDPACEFVEQHAHGNPDALVTEFLHRDAEGQFLNGSAWLRGATTCPARDERPESFAVVTSYITEEVERLDNRIVYLVTSQRYGEVTPDGFQMRPDVLIDEIVVLLTPYGWRLESPASRNYVLASRARERGLME